jgi:hypothetical protein
MRCEGVMRSEIVGDSVMGWVAVISGETVTKSDFV